MEPCLPTLAVSWNSDRVQVLCPVCEGFHNHGIGQHPPWTGQTRVSHCGEGQYQIFFPHESHVVAASCGWELDTQEIRFYTIKAGQRQVPQQAVEHHLLDPFCNLKISAESEDDTSNLEDRGQSPTERPGHAYQDIPNAKGEMPTWRALMRSYSFRKKCYLSACILKDIPQLQHLFTTYYDDFANMVDEQGRNGFLLAATKEDAYEKGVLQYLKKKGVQIHLPDNNGRLPLMEAALWARSSTVKYLLKVGADPNATDSQNMKAIDLADATQQRRAKASEWVSS